MNECQSIEEINTYSNGSDQTKFRLNEIKKFKSILILKFKKEK